MRLPSEKKLMEMFEASRISVREPLKQLASLGIVETQHGTGTYVREFNEDSFIAPIQSMYIQKLSKQGILEILEVRRIEVIAVELSAQRSTSQGVEKLKKIHSDLENHASEPALHHKADLSFHLQICEMADNPYFFQVCKLLYEVLDKAMASIVQIMGSQKAIYYHSRLIDTIQKHYSYEAREIMQEHLDTTEEAVRAIPEDSAMFLQIAPKS
jgi:DNA-binding FadR family transcriptional regulator